MASEVVRMAARWALRLGAVGVALLVPVTGAPPPASQSPAEAATRAEAEIPSLGVQWGKLRAWERVGEGWKLLWQPAHGSWAVKAWVPDAPGDVLWRLDVAPWLPGVRLTAKAVGLIAGDTETEPVVHERLGRRDWSFGDLRVLGSLPAGGTLPERPPQDGIVWQALLAGALLAGAAARAVFPGVVARSWRRTTLWAIALVGATLPFATALAPRSFEVGVRPWVAQVSTVVSAAVLLGALAVAVVRFPAKWGPFPPTHVFVALAVGVLAGRISPIDPIAAAIGVGPGAALVAGLALTLGWLTGLAGEGLRELAAVFRRLRPLLLAGVAIGVVVTAGPWLGPLVAVVLVASRDPGQGIWLGVAASWGWVAGALLASAEWPGAVVTGVALLAAALVTCSLLAELSSRSAAA